jgi:hypothetical protein
MADGGHQALNVDEIFSLASLGRRDGSMGKSSDY